MALRRVRVGFDRALQDVEHRLRRSENVAVDGRQQAVEQHRMVRIAATRYARNGDHIPHLREEFELAGSLPVDLALRIRAYRDRTVVA